MTAEPLTAPMPWFGGKRAAAHLVWDLLGDPARYLEPFAGSAAVLLRRPPGPKQRWECINDLDGWLVNMWRAIRDRPAEVVRYCDGPMTEVDYHARAAWLKDRAGDGLVSWLEGDPERCDVKAAGWWLYVCAASIGTPLQSGPWKVVNGRLVDTRQMAGEYELGGISRGLPQMSTRGITRQALPGSDSHSHQLELWFDRLAHRLQSVNIMARDWSTLLTTAIIGGRNWQTRAIFFDPPYHTSGDLYAEHHGNGGQVADQVRQWCVDADPDLRIVLAGYDTDHDELLAHGWTKHKSQGTRGGPGRSTIIGKPDREQLWASPSCVGQMVLL